MTACETRAAAAAAAGSVSGGSLTEGRLFDIRVEDEMFVTRPDTRLVFVDVPGVLPAQTTDHTAHYEYLSEAWDTLDVVLMVMDATAGVDTDDKVELLKFAEQHVQHVKKLPLLILWNNSDDYQDEEVIELEGEVAAEVEKTFCVSNRQEALSCLLQDVDDSKTLAERIEAWSPVLLPVSAESALVYRTVACRPTLEDLRRFPPKLLDRLGREDVGSFECRQLSVEQRLLAIQDVFQDADYISDRLASSNFDKLLRALHQYLAGEEMQRQLLEAQLLVRLSKPKSTDASFVQTLAEIYDSSVAVGSPTVMAPRIQQVFWRLWNEAATEAMDQLSISPENIEGLAKPMSELIYFEPRTIGSLLLSRCASGRRPTESLAMERGGGLLATLFFARQAGFAAPPKPCYLGQLQWDDLSPPD